MQPFFSIIIPTYNREEHIKETILSVLNQDFKDFELIIIDNQSTDKTWSYISSFCDQRIKMYQNDENYERCYSRNRGITISKGKFLLLLDSDDLFENNHLSLWYFFLKSQNFQEAFYISDKKILNEGVYTTSLNPLLIEHPVSYFFLHSILPGQVCIPASIAKNHFFRDDMLIFEDAALWMDISVHFPVFFNTINTFIYRVHEDNSVNELKFDAYSKRLIAIRKILKEENYNAIISNKIKRISLNATYMGIFRYHRYNSSFSVYVKWLLLAIFLFPTIHLKNKILILCQSLPVIGNLSYFKYRKFY